ncbi:MAG: aspartate kinase [Bacteroidales bacterium]|nr:aspartate kinase [Bacteroidales bacterium]
MLKVFKFGGASVKDADSVRNVATILRKHSPEKLVVILSAMGKTTNALEKVLNAWYESDERLNTFIQDVISYHQGIIISLFPDKNHPVYFKTDLLFGELEGHLHTPPSLDYDFDYDQVVSFGELISTTIISEFLISEGFNCQWFDVRELIQTDNTWREGKVNWETTESQIRVQVSGFLDNPKSGPAIALTQGFLGAATDGATVTLGREGSDYTAAIFAHALHAEEMVIWKDVPGLLNADPKYFSVTERLASISYREAIELAYYGATVIHPKTIKPLQNKDIPLRIKSFVDPESEGTVITQNTSADSLIPSFIFKVNQVLISISPRDFSFIDEQSLSEILAVFADNSIHISLMQNSAISFSVCVDHNERRLSELFEALSKEYKVRYNTGLELITIRHYDQATIDRVLEDGKTVLLEMRSRLTAQFVVRPS